MSGDDMFLSLYLIAIYRKRIIILSRLQTIEAQIMQSNVPMAIKTNNNYRMKYEVCVYSVSNKTFIYSLFYQFQQLNYYVHYSPFVFFLFDIFHRQDFKTLIIIIITTKLSLKHGHTYEYLIYYLHTRYINCPLTF